jgi:hypothetical protein
LVASPSWLDSHMTKLKEGARDKGYPDGVFPRAIASSHILAGDEDA